MSTRKFPARNGSVERMKGEKTHGRELFLVGQTQGQNKNQKKGGRVACEVGVERGWELKAEQRYQKDWGLAKRSTRLAGMKGGAGGGLYGTCLDPTCIAMTEYIRPSSSSRGNQKKESSLTGGLDCTGRDKRDVAGRRKENACQITDMGRE